MGNSSRRPQDYDIVKNYRKQDWIQYLRSAQKQLWKHRQTHQSVEVHRLYEVPSIEDLNRYEWRSSQQDIVKVFHIAYDPSGTICGKLDYVQLLVEHIPIKLTNVANLDLEQALTLLAATCRAFHAIQKNLEPVQPNEELIGFNETGRPKIWLNKKSNVNFPERSYSVPFNNTSQQVSSRVRKIFDIIEQKTRNCTLPPYLKDQFRQRSPNYLEAIAIIQQFAYRQHLSLQRYIRTDLLLSRKSSITQIQLGPYDKSHSRNHSSVANLHLTNYQPQQLFNRGSPELKKIFSVDNIHTPGRHTPNGNVSPIRVEPIPLRENIRFGNESFISNNSRPNTYRSVPKINFVTSNREPLRMFGEHPSSPASYRSYAISQNSILVNSPQKISQVLQEQVNKEVASIMMNSHLATFQKSQALVTPQRVSASPLEIIEVSPKSNFTQQISQAPSPTPVNSIDQQVNQQGEEPQQLIQRLSSLENELHEQSRHQNELQPPETQVKKNKSIIDQVQVENLQDQQQLSPNQQLNKDMFDSINCDNEVIASGTFKPINQHEMAHSEHDSQEAEEYQYKQNPITIENNHPSNPQMPLSFDSFAPNFTPGSQFVSFAPDNNINTEKSIQDNAAPTCKSVEYQDQQQMNYRDASPKLVESGEEKVVSSHEYTHYNQLYNAEVYQQYQVDPQPTYQHQNYYNYEQERRVSIDRHEDNQEDVVPENPFYADYTPVQSKFDVIIKRDSSISKEDEREQRASAFAKEKDEDIERYVREKYNSYINSKPFNFEQVKVGRVSSQYQTYKIKEYEHYDLQNLEKTKEKINKPAIKPAVAVKTPRNNISNITEKTEEDFLDVNFLEKSLDKKYSSIKKPGQETKRAEEEDQLNVAKLQQGLLKFSSSKVSQMNIEQNKEYEPKDQPKKVQKTQNKYSSSYGDGKTTSDYYSKYESSPTYDRYKYKDDKYVKENRELNKEPVRASQKKKKSVRIEPNLNVQFNYQLSVTDYSKFGSPKASTSKQYTSSFKTDDFASKYASKDYQVSAYRSKDSKGKRSSKLSNDLTNKIDQRFNKYVKSPNYNNAYSKPIVQTQKYKPIQSPRFKHQYISPKALQKGRSIQNTERDREIYQGGKTIRDAGLGERRISYDELRGLLWN